MYLSIGSDMAVRDSSIIGIFDMDNTSTSKRTRDFLNRAEKEGRVILIAPEIDTSEWKRTERRPEKIHEMYDIGYQTLMKYKDKILG